MATRPVVPRATGEGSIGTALKHWGDGQFDALHLGGGDVGSYLAESTGYGIVSGCEPTTTAAFTVNIGAGVIHQYNGVRKEITQTNVTVAAPRNDYARGDLIYIDPSGAVTYTEGTVITTPTAGKALYTLLQNPVNGNGVQIANVIITFGANCNVGSTLAETVSNIVSVLNSDATFATTYTASINTDNANSFFITENSAGGGNVPQTMNYDINSNALVMSYRVISKSTQFSSLVPDLPTNCIRICEVVVDANAVSCYVRDYRQFAVLPKNLKRYFNPIDFGAKGDYKIDIDEGTDDTAAFQRMFDEIKYYQEQTIANDYISDSVVIIPPGCYKLSSAIHVHGAVIINGMGSESTWYTGGAVLVQTGLNANIFEFYGINQRDVSCSVAGLHFRCNNLLSTTGYALYFPRYDDENPAAELSSNTIYIRDCSMMGYRYKFGLLSGEKIGDVLITGCMIDCSAIQNAINLNYTDTCIIDNNTLWECDFNTISIVSGHDIVITNNKFGRGFESDKAVAINLTSANSVENLVIANNIMSQYENAIAAGINVSNLIIKSNMITKIRQPAILLQSGNRNGAINISDNTIARTSDGPSTAAVYSASGNVSNIIVKNNNIIGYMFATQMILSSNYSVIDNVINGVMATDYLIGNAPKAYVRAWLNWNDQSGVIRDGMNISSVIHATDGQFRVNFERAMPHTNYAVLVSADINSTTANKMEYAAIIDESSVYIVAGEANLQTGLTSVYVAVVC